MIHINTNHHRQLYTHAELMLTNECITWPERYEGTTAAIVMAGIFLSFLVEYIGSRIIMRMYVKRDGNETASQSRDSGADSGEENSKSTAEASLAHVGHGLHDHAGTFFMHPQQQKLSVMVVEAGIIFHSICMCFLPESSFSQVRLNQADQPQ